MDQDQPLQKHSEEQPRPHAKARYPWLKDIIGLLLFIVAIFLGATVINAAVFRSFSVIGPSMEDTLYTGERIIINRLPVSWSAILGQEYTPLRGEIIVFKNPQFSPGDAEEYIVKRAIAFPGETVNIANCEIKITNQESPGGFDPYQDFDVSNKNDCVSGQIKDYVVPAHEVFVIGDHRNGSFSHDSRDGIGNGSSSNRSPAAIPLSDVIGPVALRLTPFDKFKFF